MNIHSELIQSKYPTAVALGYFDGVHKGHQKVISKAVSLKKSGLKPTVLTFFENPKSVISNFKENQIMTISEKKSALEHLGVEELYIINFNEIKDLSPKEFVENILYKKLNACAAICGFNYHFGKGGISNAEDLKRICKNYHIKTYIINPILYKSKPISSTRIRKAIQSNNISQIKNMTVFKQ